MRELACSSSNGRAIVLSKQWKPEDLKNDLEPHLMLEVHEEMKANGGSDAYHFSMWKNAQV